MKLVYLRIIRNQRLIWNLILGIFCVFIWFFILYFRFFLNGMAFKNRYRASIFSRIQIKYTWWGLKLTETYICSDMTLTYSGLLRHQKLPMERKESVSMSNPTYIFNFQVRIIEYLNFNFTAKFFFEFTFCTHGHHFFAWCRIIRWPINKTILGRKG